MELYKTCKEEEKKSFDKILKNLSRIDSLIDDGYKKISALTEQVKEIKGMWLPEELDEELTNKIPIFYPNEFSGNLQTEMVLLKNLLEILVGKIESLHETTRNIDSIMKRKMKLIEGTRVWVDINENECGFPIM